MTLQQLRYVTAIAETGTLSEAARRFYIAQPSLTASLRELEEELGLTIFRRTNRGAVLPPQPARAPIINAPDTNAASNLFFIIVPPKSKFKYGLRDMRY